VYLLEAADDICYGLIDLEDGIELGLLRYEEVEALIQPLLSEQWEQILDDLEKADNPRRRLQILRGQAMEAMVNAVASAFIRQQQALLAGALEGSIIDYCPDEVKSLVEGAKSMARERIFNDSRKLAIEVGSYATLAVLLENFLGAVRECVTSGKATFRNRRIIELMGRSAPASDWDLYEAYMRALDFISGMTDSYAAEMARQFSGYQPD
jgi:dGTPase